MENREKGKAGRRGGGVFIVVFCLMVVVPALLVNGRAGAVSAAEQRYLADFPPVGMIRDEGFVEFRDAFVSALQDRIGLRDVFVRTADAVKLYAMRQSPSDMVRIGKDGWYFYTGDNNIEIGTGDYMFVDEYLALYVEKQQKVKDYYAAKGIPYFFMPTPSKASVYPECLPGDVPVQHTLIDQVTGAVSAGTDVNVIGIKDYIIANKGRGQLYFKQDFHWDTLGSFLAYERIVQEFDAAGVLDGAAPIEVEVREFNYGPGEISGYFGGILPDEYAPDVVWEARARKVESGELYERVRAICEEGNVANSRVLATTLTVFENPGAEGGTLLIYGDSMMSEKRKVSACLAEHFSLVVSVGRIPNVYEALDDELEPDVVLFQRSERYLGSSFMVPGE